MKTLLALAFLETLSLMAEANLEHLRPLHIVKPVNPKYTAWEWQEIYAAQKPSPEYYPNLKEGTEPQPGPEPICSYSLNAELNVKFAGKAHVLVDEQNQRITGGTTASPPHVPWLAALVVDNSYFCSGSLISSQWVLTAAYCASGRSYQVILGAGQYDGSGSGSLIVTSTTSIIHSQYDENTMNNDIAVIQLPSEISFTSDISPVKLPPSNLGDLAGACVRLCGRSSFSSGSQTVICVDLVVVTNTVCANTYGNIITSTELCASFPGGQGTCIGDSGGPLVYKESDGNYTQVGIMSAGSVASCELGYPIVFTRVTSYLSWIESNTGITSSL